MTARANHQEIRIQPATQRGQSRQVHDTAAADRASGLVSGGVSRILIADDDPIVRDVVRRYLERDGHDVSIAHDGNEALQLLGTERVDVAILDVMMPGPDGMTLCRSMRRGDSYAVPVILLTALGEEDDRIGGLEAGADDYVTKPFSPRELVLRVRSVLRRAPSTADELPLELSAGSLRVLTAARAVTVDNRPVSLTSREFESADLPADPYRHRLLPRGIAQTGVAVGFR